jgi:hypothetical protein
MNYFAHGRHYTADPYYLAGTAVPDWLNVVDRKIRVRTRHAEPFLQHADPELVSIAGGVVQHHRDDDWFHRTRAFTELSLQFTVATRDALGPDDGLRCHFLGHILVELLLDAELIDSDPGQLERYYDALQLVDGVKLAAAVSQMSGRSADGLAWLIPRFVDERFLWDYGGDEKLLWRMNQVMRRVRLPQLPDSFMEVLPEARESVRQRRAELLTPDPSPNEPRSVNSP